MRANKQRQHFLFWVNYPFKISSETLDETHVRLLVYISVSQKSEKQTKQTSSSALHLFCLGETIRDLIPDFSFLRGMSITFTESYLWNKVALHNRLYAKGKDKGDVENVIITDQVFQKHRSVMKINRSDLQICLN